MNDTKFRYKQVRLGVDLQGKVNAAAKAAKKKRGDFVVSLITDPDKYAGIDFEVQYLTENISTAIVLEFENEDRQKFAEIADTVRGLYAHKKERKITDEMIIRQLLEKVV